LRGTSFLGSARVWDSLMTWVTLSNSACPPFFPVEEGIFDLARPLNFRGKKGVAPKRKCRGVHARRNALFRGKSVTHVMRSCPSRAGKRVLAIANFFLTRKTRGVVKFKGSSFRRDAETSTRDACAPQIITITLCLTLNAGAATLQEKIDAAAPNETICVESGVHAGAIVINKSVTLVGDQGAEVRGNGSGKVVTIAASDVTLRGLRITGSGLRLSDDDAAVFVIGNRAKIEN